MTLKESTHSIAAAAKILGISREVCSEAVRMGQLPAIKIGRRSKIPDAALKRIMADANRDTAAERNGMPSTPMSRE